MQNRYKDVTAHRLVADVCRQMAEEVAEELYSRNNTIFRLNKDRKDFVRQIGPTLRAEARAHLATLLQDPELSIAQKDEIFEALCLDNQLPKTGTSMVHRRDAH